MSIVVRRTPPRVATTATRPDAASIPAIATLEKLRAEFETKSEQRTGRERRGPLRPGQLTPTRTRFNAAAPARLFRAVDVFAALALAALVCQLSGPGGLLGAPVGAVLPYLAGAAALLIGLRAAEAYKFGAHERLSEHLLRTVAAFPAAVAALFGALWLTGWSGAGVVRGGLWLALSFAAVYLAHAGWWAKVRGWRASGRLTPNVVIVGATRNAERLIQDLLGSRDANVLGIFDDRLDRVPGDIAGVPVLGDTSALLTHRLTPYVDRIVVTVPASAQGRVRQIIQQLRVLPNEVSLFLDFDAEGASAALSRLASAPMAQVSGGPRNERRAFWKRVQDLVIGGVAVVALAPVFAMIALAIRLDSPGPVFFRQRRHGFNNEEIVVWKFRSMRQEAADATASRQVTAGDDRVTRVGRIIRNTSLDELPQIFNILKGEMSLVGPRPHAIGMKTGDTESARLVAEYAHRHRLKPGMTGWAAIKGSRGPVDTPESVRRRVALDVEYIERQSFWLDLYIIAVTVPCLLGDRHAVR